MQPTLLRIYKNILLFTLFISGVFQFHCFSQTTAIPDTNFEQALINLNIDTNGLNGNILNSDAVSVFDLNVSENFIHNLTGIEAFTSLSTLNCSLNNLSALDISQNIHLVELNANDNTISAINVALNIKLKKLKLSSNNLNSIDVTNNVDLEHLAIDLNNLVSLNVLSNIKLEYLGCYSNNLTTLNISNNTLLKYLFVNFNNLTNIDLSQNSLLKTLSCSSNNITGLNLVNNLDLSYLDCRENQLTSLDLDANVGIKRLFISNNNLNELDLSNHSNLLLLYARYNNLTSLDISNSSSLRWIKCEGNNLSTVDFRNGNNSNIAEFVMNENSNLNCIFVDDTQASFLDDWIIDPASTFVEDETECEALSVSEQQQTKVFNIYPNPATEMVSVTIETQEATLDIYSINGQLVISQPLSFGKNNIQLDALSSGMYLVKITSANQSKTKKLLIH